MMLPLLAVAGVGAYLWSRFPHLAQEIRMRQLAEGFPLGCPPDYSSRPPPRPVQVAFGLVYFPPHEPTYCEHNYCRMLRAAGHELPLRTYR